MIVTGKLRWGSNQNPIEGERKEKAKNKNSDQNKQCLWNGVFGRLSHKVSVRCGEAYSSRFVTRDHLNYVAGHR